MSAPTAPHDYVGDHAPKTAAKPRPNPVYRAVQAIASLRLTVVLFSLGMVLVLFGTLAMMRDSIDGTMTRYFRSWYVMIDLHAVTDFGKIFLGFGEKAELPGKLPFPGGYTIGWLMFINLLAAHAVRFKLSWKRIGIIQLHLGVIILLAGEFLTGQMAVETRMRITEGESARFAFSLTDFELAVIDPSDPNVDHVVVVPGSMIDNAKRSDWVSHPDLPFEIQRVESYENARARNLKPGEVPVADRGIGRNAILVPHSKVKGTDTTGDINLPAHYLTFRDKAGESLGTYLFWVNPEDDRLQDVTVGDKTYKVTYRFKRTYKPYTVHVLEATHDVYPGTTTPKDYASMVRVDDPHLGEHGPIRIWMNHPMYYAGETFYQSGMYTDPETGVKTTTLQVVENLAWTFPYLACAMVALGMIVHFLIRLTTFLLTRRKLGAAAIAHKANAGAASEPGEIRNSWPIFEKYFPLGVVVLVALMLVGKAYTPSAKGGKKDYYGFGQIPVQQGGRIQPLDSLARNSLVVISGKQEYEDATSGKITSATEWLLTLWAKPDDAAQFRIFRVEHPQILNLLGLPKRPGLYRYSFKELEERMDALSSQTSVASGKRKEQRDSYDEKILQLSQHIGVYRDLEHRVAPGLIPTDDPNGKWLSHGDVVVKLAPGLLADAKAKASQQVAEEMQKDPDYMFRLVQKHVGGPQEFQAFEQKLGGRLEVVKWAMRQEVEERSRPMARTEFLNVLPETYPQSGMIEKLLTAHRANDVEAFNAAVTEYHEKHTAGVSEGDKGKVRLEALMNHFDPFYWCAGLYVGVGVLAVLSWLVWHQPLRRAAFALACVTLAVHTAALLARMYIGNRPPVTNLYSSAVFIGWGGLALCLILERVYKLGVGTLAGAVIGFSTVQVARFLAESGDTLEMLQAVLDTNFWLATHVVCVTLGYVATFVAGLIGIVYIVGGVFTTGLQGDKAKKVAGMMYGTICFAMLLSFTGTVLGGIWADQSWGRFWGWDPKENGAVLIVIWNALILHARWGGIIKPRGMAVLAVVGNMWTAWSWFGTNQLGIGLHAYGFDNRLATGCALFWVTQALIAALGMIPLRFWASFAPTTGAKS